MAPPVSPPGFLPASGWGNPGGHWGEKKTNPENYRGTLTFEKKGDTPPGCADPLNKRASTRPDLASYGWRS